MTDYKNRLNLGPGEVVFSTEPQEVWMILGSCVAITLFHKEKGLAAVCHAQLPLCGIKGGSCRPTCGFPCQKDIAEGAFFKYLDCALRFMMRQFETRGVKPEEIHVELYGASNLMNFKSQKSIGEQNIEAAYKLIKEYGLALSKKSIGGNRGRTIYFDTQTGQVFVRMQGAGKEKELVTKDFDLASLKNLSFEKSMRNI